jgi:hypothetical protein
MVKLTKFQFENKVSKLIENNDYENLEQIFIQNPDFSINHIFSKRFDSILNHACYMKSKECFDFIITHPKYKLHLKNPPLKLTMDFITTPILYENVIENNPNYDVDDAPVEEYYQNNAANSDDEIDNQEDDNVKSINSDWEYNNINAINKAVSIYKLAPNHANSFYLQKLITNGVYFCPNYLNQLEDYPEIYHQLFMKYHHDINYMKELLFDKIGSKYERFEQLYIKLKNQLTMKDKNIILIEAIDKNSMDIIKLLKNDGWDIRKIEGKTNTNSNFKVDSISYCINIAVKFYKQKSPSSDVFKLLVKELRENPQPLINPIYFITAIVSSDNVIHTDYENFKKIDFGIDFGPFVFNCFKQFIMTKQYFHHVKLTNINIILELGLCKTNFWNFITDDNINSFSDLINEDEYWSEDIVEFIKAIVIISKNHNMEPSKDFIKKIHKL